MATRRAPDGSINIQLQKGRKSTQRDRLLAGMVAAANKGGYLGATVSEVIAQAGVSRPTFYNYFADRDECFVACVEDVRAPLLADVRSAVRERPPEDALAGAIEALIAFAVTQPAKARFLMMEVLGGTVAALDAREEGIKKIAQVVERALGRAPAEQPTPDLPIAIVIGTVQRVLGSRLRRGELASDKTRAGLLEWARSYERPARAGHWHTLTATRSIAPSPFLPLTPPRAPARLGPGRPRLAEEKVAENHRQRILFATTEAIAQQGYVATTVAEITKLAGIDGRAFYRLFAEKQEVFDAIYESGLQQMLTLVAHAYFARDHWPERIWEALRVVTQSAQGNPAGAQVALVAAYAVGSAAVQRVGDGRAAFTVFLHEGYRYSGHDDQPSLVALEAIATGVFEILYRAARERESRDTAGLLPYAAYLCLAPFMGPEPTERFIDQQLSDELGKPKRRAPGKAPKRPPVAKRIPTPGAAGT
ncbi:MAG TPA: TetR/AcrR family transcriptional regulator [Solirubrobacteraceae bacterium]|nr:TetR/AcrR family transcriptional regulator [Solirubrobacteraceae bacterium]